MTNFFYNQNIQKKCSEVEEQHIYGECLLFNLHHHLKNMNRIEGCFKPTTTSSKIYQCLDDADALVEDRLCVSHIVSYRKIKLKEVRLHVKKTLCQQLLVKKNNDKILHRNSTW